jgi:hypothetical protein
VLYLLALGYLSRHTATLRDLLLAMGSIALMASPLVQAQLDGNVRQLLIAEVFLRLRVAIAEGVAVIPQIVMRFLVDAAVALPGWMSLLAGGLLLLLIGTILTTWKDALREHLERLQADWHEMG